MMRNGDKLPAKMVNCRLRNMTIANADPLDSLEIEVWHNGPETDPLFHNVCNKKHKVFLVRDLPASCTITLWRIFFPVKANLRNFCHQFHHVSLFTNSTQLAFCFLNSALKCQRCQDNAYNNCPCVVKCRSRQDRCVYVRKAAGGGMLGLGYIYHNL